MSNQPAINTSTGQQPADPYTAKGTEDPPVAEKVEDLVKFMTGIQYGMMTTLQSEGDLLSSRCMALAATVSLLHNCHQRNIVLTKCRTQEHAGVDLIFHTNMSSGKVLDLNAHPKQVNVSFLDLLSGAWASVSGTASIVTDRATTEKYYSPSLKAWLGDAGDGVHDGGPNDPRLGVIKIQANQVTHVVAKKGLIGQVIQTIKGTVTGEVPNINSIRELSGEELLQCKFQIDLTEEIQMTNKSNRAPIALAVR